MNIPAQAIEAAAKVHYESFIDHDWASLDAALKATYAERMRIALEAAAPHMLKSAYDLGFEHGSNEPANPYRPTQ